MSNDNSSQSDHPAIMTQIIEMGKIQTRIETIVEGHTETINKIWSKLDNGLITDVDRLKQDSNRSKWWIRSIVVVVLTAILSFVFTLITCKAG